MSEGLSQAALAAKCQRMGWDLSRDTLAKIESQTRWVADFEAAFLAEALKLPLQTFFPEERRIKSVIRDFARRLETNSL